MRDEGKHAAFVEAWLARASAQKLPPERFLQLLEAAFAAVWDRTRTTLGEVTLTAIAERVLYNASEKFPFLSSVAIDSTAGIECGALRERIGAMRTHELIDGLRFVLVELLTVLGNLTAEILTPDLHAELSHVALPSAKGKGTRP